MSAMDTTASPETATPAGAPRTGIGGAARGTGTGAGATAAARALLLALLLTLLPLAASSPLWVMTRTSQSSPKVALSSAK